LFSFITRLGPHPQALSLGDFAPRSGRGRWRFRDWAETAITAIADPASWQLQSGSILRSVAVSAFDVTDVPRNARLRLRVLLVRMWRLNALLRINFPVAVFLNRFAAPRCVFNFGMSQRSFAGNW
jgi:hypothetical protein